MGVIRIDRLGEFLVVSDTVNIPPGYEWGIVREPIYEGYYGTTLEKYIGKILIKVPDSDTPQNLYEILINEYEEINNFYNGTHRISS